VYAYSWLVMLTVLIVLMAGHVDSAYSFEGKYFK
jgi:hypothetical protein